MTSRLRVQGFPAMILMKRGQELGHIEGDVPAKELLKWLEESKAKSAS